MSAERETHESTWQLLPWLANDTLDAGDRARVEGHLQDCLACREELDALRETGRLARAELEPVLPVDHFDRLLQRIDDEAPAEARQGAGAKGWLGRTPRRVRRVVFAQTAIAAGLAALLVVRPEAPPFYETRATPAAARPDGAVQVAFAPDATEAEIRALLHAVEARLVDGPSRLGVYHLAFAGDRPIAEWVAVLRSHPLVRLAEPLVARSAGPEPPSTR